MIEPAIRTHVDRMYEDFAEASSYLMAHQPSLGLTADEAFRKNLLVASASYFEERVKEIILDYVRESTDGNDRIAEFVRVKVTERGYHGLFDWNARNANQFWSSFGTSFNSAMRGKIQEEPRLSEAIRAFLELGKERNRLVHQNFGLFSLEKTSVEIYKSYKIALEFVEALPKLLQDS